MDIPTPKEYVELSILKWTLMRHGGYSIHSDDPIDKLKNLARHEGLCEYYKSDCKKCAISAKFSGKCANYKIHTEYAQAQIMRQYEIIDEMLDRLS